jgi:predicted transcriptional regulator
METRMTSFTMYLQNDVLEKLDVVAAKMNRQKSLVASQVIEEFVARENWQLDEIQAGLMEAEKGCFVADEEIQRVRNKYSNCGKL